MLAYLSFYSVFWSLLVDVPWEMVYHVTGFTGPGNTPGALLNGEERYITCI
jgi:hypothetical protein